MKKFQLLAVVALLGCAVSSPAQVSVGFEVDRSGLRVGVGVPARRAPAAVVVAPAGRWETVYEDVLVPGYWREEHRPPTYGWVRDARGRQRWALVDPGGCHRFYVPPRWERRSRQVWVPAPQPMRRSRC